MGKGSTSGQHTLLVLYGSETGNAQVRARSTPSILAPGGREGSGPRKRRAPEKVESSKVPRWRERDLSRALPACHRHPSVAFRVVPAPPVTRHSAR